MELEQTPVTCLPTNNSKMSKAKKVIEDAKQIQNPELDLVDKNVVSFEEIPGIRKYFVRVLENLYLETRLPFLVTC